MMTLIQPCFLWEEWESGAGLGVRTVFYDGPVTSDEYGNIQATQKDLLDFVDAAKDRQDYWVQDFDISNGTEAWRTARPCSPRIITSANPDQPKYDGPFKVSLGGIRYAEEADLMAHARAYGNA